MELRLVHPGVESRAGSHAMAPRLADLEGLRVGLLSNGKLNAERLLAETGALFAGHHGCRVMPIREKPFAGRPCPPELMAALAGESDFLITANGD